MTLYTTRTIIACSSDACISRSTRSSTMTWGDNSASSCRSYTVEPKVGAALVRARFLICTFPYLVRVHAKGSKLELGVPWKPRNPLR